MAVIVDMEMPIGCGWRTENAYGFAKCPFYERCLEKGIRLTRESRPNGCLLRELPSEHGDLIDRDALPIDTITDFRNEGISVVLWEDVMKAPVILEAST